MRRRILIKAAVAGGVVVTLGNAAEEAAEPLDIIDANVSLFHWPFRRLPLDDTGKLIARMRELGVSKILAGSFEGLLHRDLGLVNQRLFEECKKHRELIPIGTVNPEMTGWEKILSQCAREFDMPGLRIFPNYHGYSLGSGSVKEFLTQAESMGLFVQIASAMEDVRMQNPSLKVPDVDLEPLADVLKNTPDLPIQIMNWKPRGAAFEALRKLPQVRFDLARVDGTDGVAKLVESVGAERVLFSSHVPFLIPEAALIRTVHESGVSRSNLDLIVQKNAEALLAG